MAYSCWMKENIPLEQTLSIFFINHLFLKCQWGPWNTSGKWTSLLAEPSAAVSPCSSEVKVSISVTTHGSMHSVLRRFAYAEEETVLKGAGDRCLLKQLRSWQQFWKRVQAGPHPGRSVPSSLCAVCLRSGTMTKHSTQNDSVFHTHFVK